MLLVFTCVLVLHVTTGIENVRQFDADDTQAGRMASNKTPQNFSNLLKSRLPRLA